MAGAIEQQDVRDSSSRHVLLYLPNYADNNGKAAFPSTAKVECDTGLSESTVRRKLDALELFGLIEKGNQDIVKAYIERGDRRPVCYDLKMEKPGTSVVRRRLTRSSAPGQQRPLDSSRRIVDTFGSGRVGVCSAKP